MQLLQVILLAIVQGIAEFLPISSSGHLVIIEAVFHSLSKTPLDTDMVTLNIMLHVGTLGAIIVVYWHRILKLLSDDRNVIPLIIVGTIPAVLIGVTIKICCEDLLENALSAGCMLIVTGLLLLWTGNRNGERRCRDLSYREALIIGIFQAFAILPGISRSGSTIAAGLNHNLKRDEAATFSFLLAIPAIGGAGFLELLGFIKDYLDDPGTFGAMINIPQLAIGTGISFAVGVVALVWLLRWLEQGRLTWFAWWVLAVGPAVIVWQLLT